MDRAAVVRINGLREYSPWEPWTTKRDNTWHWYNAQADFAVSRLNGSGKCLVIGSPLFEALELSKSWDVTYMDIRKPPEDMFNYIEGDATDIDLPPESFDAVSSTCVLCHAGLGRYGDPRVSNGDEKMLAGIARVLKKSGNAALTFGCCSANLESVIRIGVFARIYTPKEARRMVKDAGFSILEEAYWDTVNNVWLTALQPSMQIDQFYLSMLLTKD